MPTRFEVSMIRASCARNKRLIRLREDKLISPSEHWELIAASEGKLPPFFAEVATQERARYEGGRGTFERAIDENPQDWPLRMVYADFLEDQGLDLDAACQRWMVERKFTYMIKPGGWCYGGGGYGINLSWFGWIQGEPATHRHVWSDTRTQAEHRLAQSISRGRPQVALR